MSEIPPVAPSTPTPSYFNKVEYDTTVVKATVRVNSAENVQSETTYTYDKHGNLLTTVVRERNIALV
jgi:YD repeat-containing protein